MQRISAIVITHNEELDIAECLKSLDFVDEIILVDSCSEDKTVEIASQFTDQIHVIPWPGYAKAKNFGIDKANNDWILSLDADERISPELQKLIINEMQRPDLPQGFLIPRRTFYFGRWIQGGGWYPDYNLRLFNRAFGRFMDVPCHEKVKIAGEVRKLSADILHFTYRSLSEQIEKIDTYTSLIAQKWLTENRKFSPVGMFCYPIWEFFRKLILKRSIIDGIQGWLLAGMHAFYVFLKYAKYLELRLKLKS